MLIKNYQPTIHKKLNNKDLCLWCEGCITKIFKNLEYNTTSLNIFENLKEKDIFLMIEEQEKFVKEQADTMLQYNFLSLNNYKKTIEQYKYFFFYEKHAYFKEDIKNFLANEIKLDKTYIQSPENKKVTWISREAIRNLTWYTYNPVPAWDNIERKKVYVKWQHNVLEDDSRIILVVGSRQIWKSFVIAEKGVECSFLPNNDTLVWWFTTETTNVIRNYVLKFIQKFPSWTFEHFKSERYVINLKTGTKLYFRTLWDDAQTILWKTLKRVIVDESQLVDEYVFEEVLKPTLSTTWWQLILIWTPWRKKSWYFYKKIIEFKRWLLKNASLYEVDITKNPFIHPEEREEVMSNRFDPRIRRQYFCEWNDWWESLFVFDKEMEFPVFNLDWFFVLGIDPARKNDRSWYSLIYIYNWKATIILSWFVPDTYKKDWGLQALYFKDIIKKYEKYKNFYTVIDVSWVWDWVAKIFLDAWIKILGKIRYTSWNSESVSGIDYKVCKTILINNALDMISEKHIALFESTNKDLLEEIEFITETEAWLWQIAFKSDFFDDITNATLIAIYFISKRRLLFKWITTTWDIKPINNMIDAIERRVITYNPWQVW